MRPRSLALPRQCPPRHAEARKSAYRGRSQRRASLRSARRRRGRSSVTPTAALTQECGQRRSRTRAGVRECRPGCEPVGGAFRRARAVAAERDCRAPRRPPRRPGPSRRRSPRRRSRADAGAPRRTRRPARGARVPRPARAARRGRRPGGDSRRPRACACGRRDRRPGSVTEARRRRSSPARSSASARTTPATCGNRASRCPHGPCCSRSSPTRSWEIATP